MRRAFSTSQFDSLSYAECSSADGYGGVVSEIQPKFIAGRIKEWFARIPAEWRVVNYLSRFHIHDDKLLAVFARNKQVLVFQIIRAMVHLAFGWQGDDLDQP